jgi:hypothetical protein
VMNPMTFASGVGRRNSDRTLVSRSQPLKD